MKTINVIESVNLDIKTLFAFDDNEQGEKDAIELFVKTAKINGASEKYMKRDINDGYYTKDDYQLFIVRSDN
jgi:hypothetical protein